MTRRLLLSYLSITVLVLLLLEIPLGVVYSRREHDRFAAGAALDAGVLASFYEDALEHGTPVEPAPAEAYSRRTGARVVVVDPDGTSVLDTGAAVPRDFSSRPEIRTALDGERASGDRRSETLDADLFYTAVPVASGGVVHGAVRLTLDAHEVDERVRAVWWALAAIGAIVLLVVAGAGWLLARSVTRPVRELRAAANRYAEGDLRPLPPPRSAAPELADLAGSLSSMARRLDDLMLEQRSFVADASHQLRTPLTSIRLQLENLQSHLTEPDAAEVSSIIAETERLTALVSDLLQLARAERPASRAPLDLGAVTKDRVGTWQAVTEAAGVELVLDAPPDPVRVVAIVGAVEQVLDNLIDNAVRASPPGGWVEVTVGAHPRGGRLAVTDHGDGLSDEQKAMAPQRFWRADPTGEGGTGLGLTIAHQLVTRSQGTLSLGDTPGGGLQVEVLLPA